MAQHAHSAMPLEGHPLEGAALRLMMVACARAKNVQASARAVAGMCVTIFLVEMFLFMP